ncbi:hypothetical protein JMJ58_16350 [Haloterrigena salifodinae]|uniref:Polysaccharide lyase n=1 Tax=Haloterrigena salifodinae TaxID=2675099 RepID=A0A8T8DZ77_9EURY|nr:hypothetical protein [Haloterrigena salifodinae]QRV14491.1 hypothetical protein JMJ58_16350 [Haloterrigena salifodinae]
MTSDQPVTEHDRSVSNDRTSGAEAGLGRRSYLKLAGSAAAALGISGVAGSAAAAGDGDLISVNYDDYSAPGDVYNVNDVRGSHQPEFVTNRTTTGQQSLYTAFTDDQKIANCEYRFPEHVGDYQDEVYTRFKIYPENFNLNQDDTIRMFWGPLTNGPGSSGGGNTDGTNGWSNAIGFANRNDSPAPEGYKFFSYSYHLDNTGSGDFQMTDAVVQMDEWNEIECHVKVNSYQNGQANADGVMQYWVNGELAFEDTSMRFTTTDDNRIEAVGPLGYVVGNASNAAMYYDEHDICLNMGREEARTALENQ